MSQPAGSIRLLNATAYERRAVVTVRHPFAPGACQQGDSVTIGTIPAAIDREELWPDGSIRSARLRAPVQVGGSADISLDVAINDQGLSLPGFKPHQWVVDGLAGVKVEFMGVSLMDGLQLVESCPYVQTYRSTHRIPMTPIWVEYTGTAYTNLPFWHFWMHWGYSDPRSPRTLYDRVQVFCRIDGALAKIHHNKLVRREADGRLVLDEPDGYGTKIRSGISQMLSGVAGLPPAGTIVPLDGTIDMMTLRAEAEHPLLAISESWGDVPGAWGPFGVVAETNASERRQKDALVKQAVREYPRSLKGHWEHKGHIANTSPGDSGAQADFGISKLARDIRAGEPYRLRGVEASVHQEACRPHHHREPDASPLRVKDHPDLWLMAGFPHRHSADQLGGDWQESDWQFLNGWTGFDIEHYSQNCLCEYAYATGDPGVLRLAEAAADAWHGSFQNRGSWPGPGRRDGRVLHGGCWLYHATGRADIKAHTIALADKVLATGEVIYKRAPDPVNGAGVKKRRDYWVPWEQAIRVYGLEAVTRMSGDEKYRDFAKPTARKTAMEGFDESGLVKYAAAWEDSGDFDRGDGGLTNWSLPCILLGLKWAQASGDGDWEARCSQILGSVLGGRDPGAVFDEVFDWMGV